MGAGRRKYTHIRRLVHWLAIVLFWVAFCGGVLAGVSASMIAARSTIVVLLVLLLGRVIIEIITTFEEV